jgi:hypothetical protein
MADEGIYVVVSVADNGVIHAWGEGPVVNGTVTPFLTRTDARRECDRMKRAERKEWLEEGEEVRVKFKVCKVLGTEPVEVKVLR